MKGDEGKKLFVEQHKSLEGFEPVSSLEEIGLVKALTKIVSQLYPMRVHVVMYIAHGSKYNNLNAIQVVNGVAVALF